MINITKASHFGHNHLPSLKNVKSYLFVYILLIIFLINSKFLLVYMLQLHCKHSHYLCYITLSLLSWPTTPLIKIKFTHLPAPAATFQSFPRSTSIETSRPQRVPRRIPKTPPLTTPGHAPAPSILPRRSSAEPAAISRASFPGSACRALYCPARSSPN